MGHLFQDQFKQAWVNDNSYLIWLSAYIHQNPTVAGLVDKPEDYKWSSYKEFIGLENMELCDKSVILDQFKNLKEFSNFESESYEIIKNRKDLEGLLLDY